ncbi:hypothetical protein HAPAU_33350 [Halalkalicoccus paucihalophilus]|uniref:Uncharacterized protein n=1 Tax=Halalkalicoccus paucihalophilus TaxID=1008153 RepID=A0A151AA31_9EURY|nr:hypothetical protein HAPAU_33350 [Halalkalicoccus paucihalophilus]
MSSVASDELLSPCDLLHHDELLSATFRLFDLVFPEFFEEV